jgi:hypothetical protein
MYLNKTQLHKMTLVTRKAPLWQRIPMTHIEDPSATTVLTPEYLRKQLSLDIPRIYQNKAVNLSKYIITQCGTKFFLPCPCFLCNPPQKDQCI